MVKGELTVRLADLKRHSSSSVLRALYASRIRSWAGVSPDDVRALVPIVADMVRERECSPADLRRLEALRAELD